MYLDATLHQQRLQSIGKSQHKLGTQLSPEVLGAWKRVDRKKELRKALEAQDVENSQVHPLVNASWGVAVAEMVTNSFASKNGGGEAYCTVGFRD